MSAASEGAANDREMTKERVSLTRLWVILALLVGTLLLKGVLEISQRYKFGINETESLPNWAFITDTSQRVPMRGQLATFVAPETPFYPRGARFVKVVAGVPGDRVEARGRDFYVNGRFVGAAKTHSRDGHPVEPGPTGIIPSGRYFVVTPHRDSLDSRYGVIGWIPKERILGVAKAVL